MNTELEQLVKKVAILAKQKFNADGGLHPFFYGIRDNGKRFIFDPAALGLLEDEEFDGITKDALSNCAKMLFALYHVQRYCYIAEAWMLTTPPNATKKDVEEIQSILNSMEGLSNHPKRIEVINFEAEDMEGNKISGFQSIIRPAGGRAYLDDDLDLHDATKYETTGRFVNLLAFRKHYDKQMRMK